MGKRDFYNPETMVVRDVPEIFDDCQVAVFKKLPGTNRMVHATWAALVEANQMYQFAHGVITEEVGDASDHYVWIHHGQHYAAAMIIRKIADALGVSNFKPREGERVEQVHQGRGDLGEVGGSGTAGGVGLDDRLSGVPGQGLPQAIPAPEGGQAVGESSHPGLGGQAEPAAQAD